MCHGLRRCDRLRRLDEEFGLIQRRHLLARGGEVQVILWPRVFARDRKVLKSQVLLIGGKVSRWDGTMTITVSHMEPVGTGVPMPEAHDWH